MNLHISNLDFFCSEISRIAIFMSENNVDLLEETMRFFPAMCPLMSDTVFKYVYYGYFSSFDGQITLERDFI